MGMPEAHRICLWRRSAVLPFACRTGLRVQESHSTAAQLHNHILRLDCRHHACHLQAQVVKLCSYGSICC